MNRWLAGGLAVLLLLPGIGALAAVSLRGGPEVTGPSGVRPTPQRAGETRTAPEPELQRFYDQELGWAPCDNDNDCARLTVPLDYADPAGDTIEIAVLRRRADSAEDRFASLVVNPGGPGASGQQYADDAAAFFRAPLLARFDVIGFDPRGVGESSPVDCLSDADLDTYLSGDPSPDDRAEERSFLRSVTTFSGGCSELTGEVLAHVSTIDTARDMDILRAALEEDTLLYFGASYGTKLGATYAMLFPDRVGRLVLDGAVDLDATGVEATLGQARGFQRAIDAYLDDCVATSPCFLGDTREAATAELVDLFDRIDRDPLPAGQRELTLGTALNGVIAPLYNRDYWFLLTNALKSAIDGDGTQLLLLADSYSTRRPDGTYASNILEANIAINCLDDPGTSSVAQVHRRIPAFEEASPVFGRAFAWGTIGCRGFTARSEQRLTNKNAEGAAPIVVVGTTRDPATPLEWAESMARRLSSAVLVTRDGDGHTAYNSDNACVDEALEDYLITGAVPPDGLAC